MDLSLVNREGIVEEVADCLASFVFPTEIRKFSGAPLKQLKMSHEVHLALYKFSLVRMNEIFQSLPYALLVGFYMATN